MFTVMIAAALCAYFVKGMCGFANTLVFSAITSFTASNVRISPLELMVAMPSNIVIMLQNRRQITARIVVPLTALVIAGAIPGIFFLKNGNSQLIKMIFGFVVCALAIEMFFRERRAEKAKPNRVVLAGIGLLSGLLCGMYGIGALLAAYVSRTTDNSSAFKGNICAVFTAEGLFRLFAYTATGIIHWELVRTALLLLPFMAVGLFCGIRLAGRVRERTVKNFVTFMLGLSGVSLVVENLLQLL